MKIYTAAEMREHEQMAVDKGTTFASATIPGLILINAEWAARIVLYQKNQNMHDAFKLTVCHEITHQENDFSFFDFFTNGTVVVFYQIIKSKMNYSCCFL